MKSLQEIAEQLQAYDPKSLSVDAAQAYLVHLVSSTGAIRDTETLPLFQALGRVLAQDVVSPFNVPPHNNSAMDGFAFAFSNLSDGLPTQLNVVGTALAGRAWQGKLGPGECLKIMTGALLPDGLDTVVPQELTEAGNTSTPSVLVPAGMLKLGDNRRLAGEDLASGSLALAQGELIGPAALGLLASLGTAQVSVRRRAKVAYFSTGDEVLSLGETPREGAIYDSNRYTVFGLLTRLGCEVIDMGVVPDEPAQLQAAFVQASAQADAIITSGGVSVGEADHTKAMMAQLGDVAFWRIAMRPGRPMAVGRIGSALLFGLPGNPVAVMVTFLAFVRPALLQLMGANPRTPPLLQAASTHALRKKPGRTEYQRGLVSLSSTGQLVVQAAGNQGSGVLSSMVQANGLIVLDHGQGNVAAGELVNVMVFDGVI